ncbi:MAG: META domain-containing protein [Rikenellaceae bacterium]|jgi:putative lipoprotein|nr:META domain-containing protein [Rikenellaceae bacterium]
MHSPMKQIAFLLLVVCVGLSAAGCCRACRAVKSKPVEGSQWVLLELNGRVVGRSAEETPASYSLTLGEDDRVTGRGDCNSFFAPYSLTGGKLSIGTIGSTRMLCPNSAQEAEYFQTLERAATANIDGQYMILQDAEGRIIASFRNTEE